MSLAAGTQVGKFVIQRKLAEGGMAEIFLASSFGPEGFEKQAVIKRIRSSIAEDATFVEMFVNEARLVSRLNHANIVQIFDFDRHEDTFYIAMEYVRGKSLAQAHQRAREVGIPVLPVLGAQIAAEVARGLGFAHRLTEGGQPLSLVHRDVTPQNILIAYEGAVKLTDFGIAKAGTRVTTVGGLKGKLAYMSPEQSRGEPVDARTDIFALGISLWELLTGKRLFDGDGDMAVLRAVQERQVPQPGQLNPAVDERLSAIVMRCLERERTARFQSAHELERSLSSYLNGAVKRSGDIDVGAWMREVFPIESARTEDTEFKSRPIPGRLGQTTVATPQERGAGVGFQSHAAPPDVGHSSARGPTTNHESGGAPRRRVPMVDWAIYFGVGVGVLAIIWGVLSNFLAKPEDGSRATTGTALKVEGAAAREQPEPPRATPDSQLAATGTLVLMVIPTGEVFIDGKSRGERKGRAAYELAPGNHQVEVKGPSNWGPKQILIRSKEVSSPDMSLK